LNKNLIYYFIQLGSVKTCPIVKTEKEPPKIKVTRSKNGRNKAAQSFFHEEAEEVNEEEEEVNEEEYLQDEVKSIVIFRNGFIYMSM
jgi:hypothetical protein